MSSAEQTNTSTPGQQEQPQTVRDEVLERVAEAVPMGAFPRMIATNELFEIQRSLRSRVADDHKRQRAILDRELGFDSDEIKYAEDDEMANFSIAGDTHVHMNEPAKAASAASGLAAKALPWVAAMLMGGTGLVGPAIYQWINSTPAGTETRPESDWQLGLEVTDEP